MTGAMWHFARTLALAGKGRADDAQAERAKFLEAANALAKTIGVRQQRCRGPRVAWRARTSTGGSR